MTRDEEIYNAINNLQIGVYDEDILSDNDEYNNDEYDGSDIQNAFYAGAKWADENPKSPWISVNEDLPCHHEELLNAECQTKKVFILKCGGFPDVDYMLKIGGKWIWFEYKSPEFWMPIPDLTEEED